MLNGVDCVFPVGCHHVAFVNAFQELGLGSLQPFGVESCLGTEFFEDCVHMVEVQVVDVLVEGVYPLDQLVRLVVNIEDLVDPRLVEFNAFLDDVDFVETFEMHRPDLLDEVRPFCVPLQPFLLLFVLVLRVFLQLSLLLTAHLNGLLGELLPRQVEVVINLVEGHVSSPNELLNCQPLLNCVYLISQQEEHDQLRLYRDCEALEFIHVYSVLPLQVIRVINVIQRVQHLTHISILQI